MITYAKDLLERIITTFLEAFIAAISLTGIASVMNASGVVDWSALEKIGQAAAIAGIAAVISFVKGLLARGVGENGTASLAGIPAVSAADYDLGDVDIVNHDDVV